MELAHDEGLVDVGEVPAEKSTNESGTGEEMLKMETGREAGGESLLPPKMLKRLPKKLLLDCIVRKRESAWLDECRAATSETHLLRLRRRLPRLSLRAWEIGSECRRRRSSVCSRPESHGWLLKLGCW